MYNPRERYFRTLVKGALRDVKLRVLFLIRQNILIHVV